MVCVACLFECRNLFVEFECIINFRKTVTKTEVNQNYVKMLICYPLCFQYNLHNLSSSVNSASKSDMI